MLPWCSGCFVNAARGVGGSDLMRPDWANPEPPFSGDGAGRSEAVLAGGFLAVRCDRPVQGRVIESARSRPRPQAVERVADMATG